MALKVFLKHPWYDPDGYYRRVEDNPHTVEFDLDQIPSTASIEEPGAKGEKKLVWELRGETDPTLRAEQAREEYEARKVLPLARALSDPKGTSRDAERLEKENEQLKRDLAAAQKKLEVPSQPPADSSPPIQQQPNAGTNAVPGSNPVTHGTQANMPQENSTGTDAQGKPTKDPDNTDLKPVPTKK